MVLLEAWLAGTPGVVNGGSPVLREHCRASGGGLWFGSRAELVEALDLLLGRPGPAARLAAAGAGTPRGTFSWARVRERFLGALKEWS